MSFIRVCRPLRNLKCNFCRISQIRRFSSNSSEGDGKQMTGEKEEKTTAKDSSEKKVSVGGFAGSFQNFQISFEESESSKEKDCTNIISDRHASDNSAVIKESEGKGFASAFKKLQEIASASSDGDQTTNVNDFASRDTSPKSEDSRWKSFVTFEKSSEVETQSSSVQDGEEVLKYSKTSVASEAKGGFAKSFEKFRASSLIRDDTKGDDPKKYQSFATLLRNSKFIQIGDPEGKLVLGKIFHIVANDLYIDFGGKFHCVCQKPAQNADLYVRGAVVRLRLLDMEMSTRFLGHTTDVTILEADAVLIGLHSSPLRSQAQGVQT